MIAPRDGATPLLLSMLAATGALAVALVGIVNQDIYEATTPARMMPGAMSQDIVTVFASLALLVFTITLRGGSPKGWLVWLGLVGYLLYAYAIYTLDAVLNPFYPIYIVVFSASIFALITFFNGADRTRLSVGDPPRRGTAVLFFCLAALFAALWLSILLDAIATSVRPDGFSILMIDLTFVLPLLVFTGLQLWRGAIWGDLLAIPLLIKMATLGLSVLLGTLLAPTYDLPLRWSEVATYAALGLLPLAVIVPFWRHVRVE